MGAGNWVPLRRSVPGRRGGGFPTQKSLLLTIFSGWHEAPDEL